MDTSKNPVFAAGDPGRRGLRGIVEADEKFFRDYARARAMGQPRPEPGALPQARPPAMAGLRAARAAAARRDLDVPDPGPDRHRPRGGAARRRAARPARGEPRRRARPPRRRGHRALLDGDAAYDLFARRRALPHYRLHPKTDLKVIRTAFHIQTVNNLHSRFESFMKPFCGPATTNLPGYAAWFITRLIGDETAARGTAWQRLLAA